MLCPQAGSGPANHDPGEIGYSPAMPNAAKDHARALVPVAAGMC